MSVAHEDKFFIFRLNKPSSMLGEPPNSDNHVLSFGALARVNS